jgi:hypothetical protein
MDDDARVRRNIRIREYKKRRARADPEYRDQRQQKRQEWWERNGEAVRARRAEQRLQVKIDVIGHYGGACSCCGERILLLLTIDHINDDGSEHRKQLAGNGGGYFIYRWLQTNGYPEGFQVSCWNCNVGRHLNGGICPHQAQEEDNGDA